LKEKGKLVSDVFTVSQFHGETGANKTYNAVKIGDSDWIPAEYFLPYNKNYQQLNQILKN
jgi:hypothetical protein